MIIYLVNGVIASVDIDCQVFIEVDSEKDRNYPFYPKRKRFPGRGGVLLRPEQARALGEALIRAADGDGIPAGPSTPGTKEERDP